MHVNTKMIIPKYNIYKVKNCTYIEIMSKLSPSRKENLKQPLSRGSHFKIHFGLEFRENRGSSQNFHGVPFSEDRKIITSSHTIYSIFLFINVYYTYLKHEI